MGKSSPRPAGKRPHRRKFWLAASAAGMLVLAVFTVAQIRDYLLGAQLAAANPDQIPSNPELVRYANTAGRTAFESNCASCHGADMNGRQARGVPKLTDNIWLYDFGRISDIKPTV